MKYKLLVLILLLDLLMVVFHLLWGRDQPFFHLDYEQNLPTIYQGTKLILTSTLIFTHIFILLNFNIGINLKRNLIWIPFYLIFLFIGVDELSQFHESFSTRVVSIGSEPIEDYVSFFDKFDFTSATWLLIYIPAFLIFSGYIYVLVKSLITNYKKESLLLIIGALFFLAVPILELVNTSKEFWGTDTYEGLMIMEETAEMVGATFFLYFSWIVLRKIKKRDVVDSLKLNFS